MNPHERSLPTAAMTPALAYAAHGRAAATGNSDHSASNLSAPSAGLAASGGVQERQQHSENEATASSQTGGKRKRVVLSVLEKQQVLQRLELGEPPASLASLFGISRQQVSDIKKNRARILAFCIDAKHVSSLQRKTLRATSEFHPGVEQELYRWIIRQRRLLRPVTPDALTAKAASLFQQYAAAADLSGSAHTPLKSVGVWLRHFRRAHGLKVLSDDEIQQLPDSFSPAMEMALNAYPGPSDNGGGVYSAGANSLGPSMGLATSTSALNMDDVGSFMAAPTGAYHPLPQHATATLTATDLLARPGAPSRGEAEGAATPGLMGVVEAVQHLNAQVGTFEQTMALKLDDLDARVEKLSFAVLPTRFA